MRWPRADASKKENWTVEHLAAADPKMDHVLLMKKMNHALLGASWLAMVTVLAEDAKLLLEKPADGDQGEGLI